MKYKQVDIAHAQARAEPIESFEICVPAPRNPLFENSFVTFFSTNYTALWPLTNSVYRVGLKVHAFNSMPQYTILGVWGGGGDASRSY
jgi:hypothetical protein